MNHPETFPPSFRLHQWLVRPNLNRIDGPDGSVQIEPRVMAVLLTLAARPNAVVSRLEILDEVWGDTVVGEEILTRAVSELRRVFGDNPRQPSYIETIRHVGYRLIAPIVPAEPDEVIEPSPQSTQPAAEKTESITIRQGSWFRLLVLALIVVVLVVAGQRTLRRDSTTSPAGAPAEAVPLTSFPGREFHPSLAPDGTRVAFAWSGPDTGRTTIHIKQRNSESTLQLTDEPGWAAWPVWTPDGQAVAFVQTADTVSAIGLVPSLGGAIRWLHRVAGLVEGLDWSPDQTQLVFAAQDTVSGRYRLYRMDPGGHQVVPLSVERPDNAGDLFPRFSPDGKQIAWVGLDRAGGSTLFVAPAGGGAAEAIVSYLAPIQGLAWLPESRSLVYAAADGGVYRLWQTALSGVVPRLIPTPGEFAWNPTIARETGALVFEQVSVDQDIWRVVVAERDPWRLEAAPFLASTRWESEADFSPDGRAIALVSSRSGRPEIWLSDAHGEKLRQLTTLGATAITNLRWAPDGAALACNVTVAGIPRIAAVDAESGDVRELSAETERALFVGWGATGRNLLIAVHEDGAQWQVHRRPLAGGESVRITRNGGLAAQEAVDGRTLYFTRPDRPGLWRRRVGGRVSPELVLPDLMPIDRFNWRLDGNRVVWILRSAGATLLMEHDLTRDRSQIVAELPGFQASGLSVLPGQDVFFYPRQGEIAGDLMLFSAWQGAE